MKAMFDEGWKAVTFGSDQIMMDWCRKRFEEGYWMGNPVRGIGPDSVKFLMGDLKAELRRTPEGMDLYLSKEGTRVRVSAADVPGTKGGRLPVDGSPGSHPTVFAGGRTRNGPWAA